MTDIVAAIQALERKQLSRDEFIYGLKACGFTVKDGQTYYDEQELIKCFDDLYFSQELDKDLDKDRAISLNAAKKAVRHAEVNFSVKSEIDFTKHQREVQEIIDNILDAQEKALRELPPVNPCEDEYIKVPKKALKYRTAGMVAYNAEWLKNHFDIERVVICGAQESCEDAISREAVLLFIEKVKESGIANYGSLLDIATEVRKLPSVNPQEKTGHWITGRSEAVGVICSECGYRTYNKVHVVVGCPYRFCPNCGAMMVEPQESEG